MIHQRLPGEEFLGRELIALARLLEGADAALHRVDDRGLAPDHPSLGVRRRQAFIERLGFRREGNRGAEGIGHCGGGLAWHGREFIVGALNKDLRGRVNDGPNKPKMPAIPPWRAQPACSAGNSPANRAPRAAPWAGGDPQILVESLSLFKRLDRHSSACPAWGRFIYSAPLCRRGAVMVMYGGPTEFTMRPMIQADYRPSEDEEFMNPRQLEYFRQKLLQWREELLVESSGTLINIKDGGLSQPDVTDRATLETDRSLELRTRDRERKLVSKIDEALQRIEDGRYGYCEDTDEPIGLRRLEARPIATLSLEAQERHERRERTH